MQPSYMELYGRQYYDSMRKKIESKVRDLICKEHNLEISDQVKRFISKGISINKDSFKKLEHIVDKFGDSIKGITSAPHEIALYLLADKSDTRENLAKVSDVYIAHNQEVFPSFVKITGSGDILSLREIRGLDKKVIGWGHSHGMHGTFFSGTDRRTIDDFLSNNKTFGNIELDHYGHTHDLNFGYTFGIVINARKDKPFVALNIEFPYYDVVDGKITRAKKREYHENVNLNIIKTENYRPDNEENLDIEKKLQKRVIINGKRLEEHLSFLPDTKPKKTTVPKESGFKVAYQRLKEKYDTLFDKYREIITQSKKTEDQNLYLQLQCADKTYSGQMRHIYNSDAASSEARLASKILAGDYRGGLDSIADGYIENPRKGYIWRWSERMEAIRNLDLGDLKEGESKRIKEIINENRYFRTRYPDLYMELNRLIR